MNKIDFVFVLIEILLRSAYVGSRWVERYGIWGRREGSGYRQRAGYARYGRGMKEMCQREIEREYD